MPFTSSIKQFFGFGNSKGSHNGPIRRPRAQETQVPASQPCTVREDNVKLVNTAVSTQRVPSLSSESGSSSSSNSTCGSSHPLWALPEMRSSCRRVTDSNESRNISRSWPWEVTQTEPRSGREDYGFDVWLCEIPNTKPTLVSFPMYVSWSELIARVALKTHRSPKDIAFFLNKKYVGYVSNEAEYEKWLETAHDAKTWKPDLYLL